MRSDPFSLQFAPEIGRRFYPSSVKTTTSNGLEFTSSESRRAAGDPAQYPVAKQQAYPATADPMQWHPWFDQTEITDIEPLMKQQYLRRGY